MKKKLSIKRSETEKKPLKLNRYRPELCYKIITNSLTLCLSLRLELKQLQFEGEKIILSK